MNVTMGEVIRNPIDVVNGMRNHTIERELSGLGWQYCRKARHGDIWKLKEYKICLPRKLTSGDHRAIKNFRSELKRIHTKIELDNIADRMNKAPDSDDLENKVSRLLVANGALNTLRTIKACENEVATNESIDELIVEAETSPEIKEETVIELTKKEEPPMEDQKQRLAYMPKDTRKKEGKKLFEQLKSLKDSNQTLPLITKEQLASLYLFAGYANYSSMVASALKGYFDVAFVKDQDGTVLFESKDVMEQIKYKVAEQQSSAQEPEDSNLMTFQIGPFSRRVTDFYAAAARNKNTTVTAIFNKMISSKAEGFQKMMDKDLKQQREEELRELERKFEEKRQKMLASMDIEF